MMEVNGGAVQRCFAVLIVGDGTIRCFVVLFSLCGW